MYYDFIVDNTNKRQVSKKNVLFIRKLCRKVTHYRVESVVVPVKILKFYNDEYSVSFFPVLYKMNVNEIPFIQISY